MNVDEVIARECIRNAMATYNRGGDSADYNLLASVFHEEGVFIMNNGATSIEGRQNIANQLSQRARLRGHGIANDIFQRHNLTTNWIKFSGQSGAMAHTYFFVLSELGPDHAGEYTDRFVKCGDDWLIAEREVALDWMRPDSRFYQSIKP